MRAGIAVALIAFAGRASADVQVGGAVGAGGQGDASYSALELSVDATWDAVRVGLAARGVWLDGGFRSDDWTGGRAVRAIRLVEAHRDVGDTHLAAAAGGLAPAQVGHVADGYRATLDDRPRTGVRTALATTDDHLTIGAELDDVVEPELAAGAAALQRGDWIASTATAVDLAVEQLALELSGARRWADEGWRVDAGGGAVGERHGGSVVGFVDLAYGHEGATRWIARAEVRGGTGTVGGAFGPLHRIERDLLYARSHRGVGGALGVGAVGSRGWITAGVRSRPGLGPLGTLAVGAPVDRRIQLAGWVAASSRIAVGAGELRVAWARHLASAVELARIVADEPMAVPAWSATVWFAVDGALSH